MWCWVNAATMLVAYYSFSRIGGHRAVRAVAAFAYTLCAYRLTNLMLRGSVGGVHRHGLLCRWWRWGPGPLPGRTVPLPGTGCRWPLGMAGIVQSHLLTTELAASSFCAVLAVQPAGDGATRRLLAACKAVVVAVGLSCWFLLPCLQTLKARKS